MTKELKNTILVRDLSCDTFSEARLLKTNETDEFIGNLIAECRENWYASEEERCLQECIEERLNKQRIEYEIVYLDDLFKIFI